MAKPSHSTCVTCGNTIVQHTGRGRAQKYCSSACKPSYSRPALRPEPKNCDGCGQSFTPINNDKRIKYCSRKCKDARSMRGRFIAKCDHCGNEYLATRNSGGVYCGRSCSMAARNSVRREIGAIRRISRKQKRLRESPIVRECEICGSGFRPTRNNRTQVCCSDECSHERNRRQSYLRVHGDKTYRCKVCGCEFCKLRGAPGTKIAVDFCSDNCRDRMAARVNRAIKARRAAHERGLIDGSESFDPFVVFRRDGWKCKSCGVATPKRLRGSCDPDAPELDHIIPLSRGGWHAPDNCQTLCRQCNGNKGAQLPDEWSGTAPKTLRLF